MPNVRRSPPQAVKGKLKPAQSKSDPDLPTTVEEDTRVIHNVTSRHKRPRIFGSPSDEQDPSKAFLTKFKNELLEMLEDWKLEQKQTLSQLVTDVAQLKTQCLKIQQTNCDIEKSMGSLNQDYEDITTKVSELESAQGDNQKIINQLEKQVQELQLKCRPSAIEIRNLPAMPNEKVTDLLQILTRLGRITQMDICNSNIRDIYRLPGKPGVTRSIFVEFTSVYLKNNFLAAVRNYNKERQIEQKLNTESIGITGNRQAIYVDEYLPPTSKRLYYLARDFAKRNNYNFCWISNGKILLRKDTNTKVSHFIKTEQCLLDLESKK